MDVMKGWGQVEKAKGTQKGVKKESIITARRRKGEGDKLTNGEPPFQIKGEDHMSRGGRDVYHKWHTSRQCAQCD